MRTPGKVTAVVASTIGAIALAPSVASAATLGSVTTKSPQDVGPRTVTLQAESTLSVLGASVSFQYGPTTAYGSVTPSVLSSLLGVKETTTIPLGGLTPNTTYHFRAVATSALTSVYGRDVSFKTDKDDGRVVAPAPTDTPTSGGPGATTTAPAPTTGAPAAPAPATPTPAPAAPSTGNSGSGKGKDNGKDDNKGKNKDKGSSSPGKSGDDHPGPDDPAGDVPAGSATKDVTPVLGRTLAVAAVQGTVTATSPAGVQVDLGDARAVPTGTIIDTRGGTVELTTALDHAGAKQTGRFWGAMFEVRQSRTKAGMTQIVLRGADFRACHAVSRAATTSAKKKKPARTLWGSDSNGRFQTRGRGSVATVRGTRWVTTDTCSGTVTKVLAGAVAVRDFGADRTVVVHHGHQYEARVAQ